MQISRAATTQPVVAAFLHAFSIGGRANTQKLENGHTLVLTQMISSPYACVCVCACAWKESENRKKDTAAQEEPTGYALHGTSVGN